jgi:hypothetical protein
MEELGLIRSTANNFAVFSEHLLGSSVPYPFTVIGIDLFSWLRGYEPFAIDMAIQYLTCAHKAGP